MGYYINSKQQKNKCRPPLVMVGRRCCNTSPPKPSERYYKNKLPVKDKMNSSNNNSYMLKSYLKFFKWVSDEMRSLPPFIRLAMLRHG